jgi:hypothetical protein
MMGHAAVSGAVELTKPSHLLAKLAHEAAVFGANLNNSYAAINALRDAYHLREWVWQDRLHPSPPLQTQIMGRVGGEDQWASWINQEFSEFPTLIDLCTGSKRFERGSKAKQFYNADPGGEFELSHNFRLYDPGLRV